MAKIAAITARKNRTAPPNAANIDGLSSKVEGGVITLRTRLVEGRLHIEIEDDGVGMEESKLATMFDSGIGVSNVNERLHVLFGDDYRMDVDSRPGEGTRTHIEFPDLSGRR